MLFVHARNHDSGLFFGMLPPSSRLLAVYALESLFIGHAFIPSWSASGASLNSQQRPLYTAVAALHTHRYNLAPELLQL